ncbi:MAG TPA: protein kinase [Planctomycetota bacterium]
MTRDEDRLQERFLEAVTREPAGQQVLLKEVAESDGASEAQVLERLLELDQAEGPLVREPSTSGAPLADAPLPCPEGSPPVAGLTAEKYELLGEIGAGAFGHVYRARHRELRREVALKVHRGVPESCRERFLAEARALARVSHQGVVTIHDVHGSGDALVLEMELVEGENFHQLVERSGPLAPREAALVGLELCRALAAIHRAGLVHMDVKPANVMRATGGRIVLLDFGLTRRCSGEDAQAPVGGTPAFMAPECYDARARVGPAADVYSLGVTLYWLVTGRYPYPSSLVQRLRYHVLEHEPLPLVDVRPDLPREFVAVVERAMRPKPEERFATMGELERALGDVLDSQAARRPSRRRVLAVGGAALAASAGLWWLASRPTPLAMEHEFHLEHDDVVRVVESTAEIEEGDFLSLVVHLGEPLHLYLFQEDGAGASRTLFPFQDGRANPLPAGSWTLPDFELGWELISSGGGSDHIYLLASRQPLPSAEQLVRVLEPVRSSEDPGAPEAQHDLRGVQLALRGDYELARKPPKAPVTDLKTCFADLEHASGNGRFFRHLELINR